MQIEEGAHLGWGIGSDRGAQLVKFRAGQREGVVQAGHFVHHFGTVDMVLAYIQVAGGQQVRAPDHHAQADALAGNGVVCRGGGRRCCGHPVSGPR